MYHGGNCGKCGTQNNKKMKIRNSFVSNSSSSSFIIIGRCLTNDELKLSLLKGENKLKAVGRSLSDGSDVIDIDSVEKLAFVKAVNKLTNSYDCNFTVYEQFFMGEELTVDVETLRKKLPEKGEIGFFSIEQDYHGCQTIEDMFNNYSNTSWRGGEDSPTRKEIKQEMQVLLRAKKLRKLNNNEEKND